MDLNKIPILKSIIDYEEENVISLHMPGHKKGKVYEKVGLDFWDRNVLLLDTTEVPGIDNLHSPEEAIRRAQEQAAGVFGAGQSFFLVNGTTGGIYAMIMAVTEPGDKIIVPRNCHRAVAGAVILGRLVPVYISPEVDDVLGVAMGVEPETVEEALVRHPDAKAVVITNPTFYGACSDMEKIAEVVHHHGKLLLVDEAHGAHLSFHERLPLSALEAGADIVAQSIHKTLPAMTQASMLHVSSDCLDKIRLDKLKLFLQLTQTTSPSHLLLATLDTARYVMEEKGEALLEEVIGLSEWAREEINKIPGLYCLGRDRIGQYGIYDIDPTRITVNFSGTALGGSEAEYILRKSFKLQLEMSDLYNIVAITTVGDDREVYKSLVEALRQIAAEHPCVSMEKKKAPVPIRSFLPEIELLPWEAIYREKEMVNTDEAIGRIAGEMLIPYPPGIPVVMPGEIIREDVLVYLKECVACGIKINGVSDTTLNKIAVIK